MTYLINECFYTLQGEGYWSGRAAAFCRFSRCNLWSGKEEDRHRAICQFCDTDFSDYTEYSEIELVEAIDDAAPGDHRMVVFTGGEPALQLGDDLVGDLRNRGFYVAVETNGTLPLPDVDWVCVSPKTPRLRIRQGNELKLVYPQTGRMQPDTYEDLEFDHFWISPMDGPNLTENTQVAVEYVKAHPQWRLNTQTHKQIGIR